MENSGPQMLEAQPAEEAPAERTQLQHEAASSHDLIDILDTSLKVSHLVGAHAPCHAPTYALLCSACHLKAWSASARISRIMDAPRFHKKSEGLLSVTCPASSASGRTRPFMPTGAERHHCAHATAGPGAAARPAQTAPLETGCKQHLHHWQHSRGWEFGHSNAERKHSAVK